MSIVRKYVPDNIKTIKCLDGNLEFLEISLPSIRVFKFRNEVYVLYEAELVLDCINECYENDKFIITNQDPDKVIKYYRAGLCLGEKPIINCDMTRDIYNMLCEEKLIIDVLNNSFKNDDLPMGYLRYISDFHVTYLFEKYASFRRCSTTYVDLEKFVRIYFLTCDDKLLEMEGRLSSVSESNKLPECITKTFGKFELSACEKLIEWYYSHI